ncbi:MAG: glycosyltransferase [Thermoanaerobaculia bacterium]
MKEAPVTVGIPTFGRGARVTQCIERALSCDPPPGEVIVHIDSASGTLSQELVARFPQLRILTSKDRVGPGGGRGRCIAAAQFPYFASFDDDSWPIDADFFAALEARFAANPQVACLAATIFHRGQDEPERTSRSQVVAEYVGCGYALRVDRYRNIGGHIDRKIPYGFEERDLSLQLHGAGWQVLRCGDLRVLHDTALSHHNRPEITSGTIENAVLLAWIRYPIRLWPYAALQFANTVYFLLSQRRFAGIAAGVVGAPFEVWRHRHLRQPMSATIIRSFLRLRPVKAVS